MAWRFTGRAHVDPNNPRAFAVCDRCGIWSQLNHLNWQYQYAGPRLQNLRLLVCDICLDTPQPQLKPRILPPDPVPVMNARPELFDIDNETFIVTNSGDYLVTHDGTYLVTWMPAP